MSSGSDGIQKSGDDEVVDQNVVKKWKLPDSRRKPGKHKQ
jgi:hypothetical protein